MKLHISEQLSLPIDAATQTFAFLGRKGSGKTYAAAKLVELLLEARVQVVILDTVGNWYGLRLAADGKSKGFDIPVIGGLRGDIPLEEGAGALIANTLADTGRSAVLDVSQFSKAARQRFALAFGEQLWQRKKAEAHPSPMHLVIEECQLIIPQNLQPDQKRMVGIYEEIVRLGRNYGIGASMLSQRPQSVNKEVLNQTECLFVFQTNGAHERKALKEWVVAQGASVDLVQELPSLPVGTAYVWSPQWLQIFKRVTIAPKTTYDSSATPRVGDKRPAARTLRPLDLDDLKQQMQAVIERAKQDDSKALRARIAELERTAKKLAATPVAPKPTRVEVPVLTAKHDAHIRALLKSTDALAGELRVALKPLSAPALQPRELVRRLAPAHDDRPKASPPPQGDAAAAIGKGEKKILIAAAQHPDGTTREQLSILTGYKRSTRDNYIQRLRGKGHVEERAGRIYATEAGVTALGSDYELLPTGDRLRDYWMLRLPAGERAVLEVIACHYPSGATRDEISEVTGYKRSTRDTYIQRLDARRLVVVGRESVTASEELFG